MKRGKSLKPGILIIVYACLISTIAIYAQSNVFTGDWEGLLRTGGVSLKLVFHIKDNDGIYKATMDSPDQGAYGISIDEVTIDGSKLTLEIKKIMVAYTGSLNDDGTSIFGTWKQGPVEYTLNLRRETVKAMNPDEIVFDELWDGILKVSAIELRIVLKIYTDANGSLAAFMDSPDQEVKNISVSSINISDSGLIFTADAIGGSFEGTFNNERTTLSGTWKQAGQNMKLNFKKVDKLEEAIRPQNPQKPYPYKEEEIFFESIESDITLAGTLTIPEGEGYFPGVVLVSGSGPQDRDGTIFNHKPFWVLADYLTRNGIAVLRYDDRGTASSQGDFSRATTEDLTLDAISAVNYLNSHDKINKDMIGIIGHSEGGLIASLAAVNSDLTDFIVLLAGPGLPGKDILLMQLELIMRADGASEEIIVKELELSEKIYNVVESTQDDETAKSKISLLLDDYFNSLSGEEKDNLPNSKDTMLKQAYQLLSPWFRFFIRYDPRPTLEQVTIPLLALNGEKDLQVPSNENLGAIEKALEKGGNNSFKLLELEGLNHLFQKTSTGAIAEYGKLEETFSSAAMEIIKNWIIKL
ncbi:MAG: alpha/beta fold hydrolase [Melioribacteraceae bacterium]|nr:alpha/beta fold hydrolase [Melioribacteraceae bacterium]